MHHPVRLALVFLCLTFLFVVAAWWHRRQRRKIFEADYQRFEKFLNELKKKTDWPI